MLKIEDYANKVMDIIPNVRNQYHRLILLVGSSGKGNSEALTIIQKKINAPLININLELSNRLLELTEKQRSFKVPQILTGIVDDNSDEVILLDNIELLFNSSFNIDPLRFLQGLSRNKIIIAAWPGKMDSNHLYFASQDHPDYRRYQRNDSFYVSMEE